MFGPVFYEENSKNILELVTRGVEPRALLRERGGFFGKRVR